jgi:hypothetical protein
MMKRFAWIDFLPAVSVLGLILAFSVDVPYSDDWELVPILAKMNSGTLTLHDLAIPYASHEMIFSYALMGWLAVLTHWNTLLMRLVGFAMVLGAWLAIRPSAIRSGRLFTAAVVFFGLNQAINFLWTWQIALFMALFCSTWCLRLAVTTSLGNWILAVLLAVIGSLSYGAGISLWPALFYLALADKKVDFRVVLTLAGTLLVAWLYILNHVSENLPPFSWNLSSAFFLSSIGSPVMIFTGGLSVLAGAGLIFLGCRDWPVMGRLCQALWLTSLVFSLIILEGRNRENAVFFGTNSRYGTFAMLAWVAIVIGHPPQKWHWVPLAILFACLLRDGDRLVTLPAYKMNTEKGLAGIWDHNDDRFLIKGPSFTRQQFDERDALLRQWHYSLYRQNSSPEEKAEEH